MKLVGVQLDLAAIFRLKHWTEDRLQRVWVFAFFLIAALWALDFYIKEPSRTVDVPIMAIGALALCIAAESEAKGRFIMRSHKPVVRSERPVRFRSLSNQHTGVGVLFLLAGALLQIWGFYIKLRYGKS